LVTFFGVMIVSHSPPRFTMGLCLASFHLLALWTFAASAFIFPPPAPLFQVFNPSPCRFPGFERAGSTRLLLVFFNLAFFHPPPGIWAPSLRGAPFPTRIITHAVSLSPIALPIPKAVNGPQVLSVSGPIELKCRFFAPLFFFFS